MFMNISSFIVKASSERSAKSLGCLIPMTIGRVPRLSRRNKQLQIKVGSSRLFDTFLAMKKVWNYKIRFSISLMITESRQKGKNYFFIYFSFPIDEKNQKSRLILFCLNSTRHFTIASRHLAHAGPFAINVHWTFIERSVLFGHSAVSYLLNFYEK